MEDIYYLGIIFASVVFLCLVLYILTRIQRKDKKEVGFWRHTVIELYPNKGGFPSEGDPADWIEQNLVSWCQGHDETVVYFAPLWWILWIKVKKYASDVHTFFYNNVWAKTPWWERNMEKFRAELDEKNTISSTEELETFMGEEAYTAMEKFIGIEDGD